MKYLILLIISGLIISCNSTGVPKGIMDAHKMQMIYWDLITADNLAKEIVKKDSTKKLAAENIKYINQVLAIHKISKDELNKSLNYYQNHPDLLGNIFDSIQVQESKNVMHPWDAFKKTDTLKHAK